MKTQRQSIREGCHIVTRRSKRLKKISENGKEDSLPLPNDLILEIFSRLSAKSIAICRCVSKLWATVLGRPDFTGLFSTKSSARPQILFACRRSSDYSSKKKNTFLLSLPQLQNADEYLSPLVVNPLTHFPLKGLVQQYNNGSFVSRIGGHLGFVKERNRHEFYNPSTGRSLSLPNVKTERWSGVCSYFGYDPVEKLFKILSMTVGWGSRRDGVCGNHQVLTLGSEKPQWRMIECGIPHNSFCGQGICINGVLYYLAKYVTSRTYVMVCFDFRCEKFSYFDVMGPYGAILAYDSLLIVYNDKLALLQSDVSGYLRKDSTSIELIVIGDFVKQEWSKHTYVLPLSWKTTVGECPLWTIRFVGVTRTNEIVLSSSTLSSCCYLFFYNMERSTFTRVEINGMDVDSTCQIQIFLDHIEDLKLIGG